MSNLLFGILTTILCLVAYFYSWRFQRQEYFNRALLLLILSGLLLRIYTSTDFFLHQWDERFHALVAKNVMKHPLLPTLYDNPLLPYDFTNWSLNHIWLHKQPLPLWTMAASMWLFGVNEIALRLPSIVLTTAGIWLTFSIGNYFFNKKVAYLAAFFYSINGLIIEITGGRVATDHIDIFFLFFVELAIFFSIKFAQGKSIGYTILVGLSLGAAILSKWLPALIVLPVWLLIVVDAGNFKPKSILIHFCVLAAVCMVVFLPWQLYIFRTFPIEAGFEAASNLKHITQVLDEQGGGFFYFLNKIRINYGELIYVPIAWFLWLTFKTPKDFKRLAISVWFLIPFLFFSFAKTKMQAYILFTSPALFIITAEFWHMLYSCKAAGRQKWLINIILFLLIALPAVYTVERAKPFALSNRNPQWVADLKRLNERQIVNGVLFNYNKPIEAMFYTNLTVYKTLPNKQTILKLIEKGYTVLINDNGTIPADIKAIDEVLIEAF